MESRLFALNAGLMYMCIYIYINLYIYIDMNIHMYACKTMLYICKPILYILSYTYARVHIHIYVYSLLHLECHLISNSNLNFRGLFSTIRKDERVPNAITTLFLQE